MLLLAISPVFAGDKKVRSFTNEDLEKYKASSDTRTNADPGPSIDTPGLKISGDAKQALKQYVIPYTAYEGTSRRIIIPVTFNDRITAPMLLDTGAPGMHISYRLAEKLGVLEDNEGKLWISVSGIGGAVPAIYTIIDKISVGDTVNLFNPTVVSGTISNDFEGLIGMDFMANYSVRIDTKKHLLVLEELPKRPDMPAGHDEEWWRLTFRDFMQMRARWEKYREDLNKLSYDSARVEALKRFADKQYSTADELLNRLKVFAGEHAVPMEWR